MLSSTKSFLNFLFFLFAAGGGVAIFFVDRIDHQSAFLIPTVLTALYGIIIGGGVSGSRDFHYAQHQIDTIYFMGFLYTLMSLVTLFYKLKILIDGDLGEMALSVALNFLAIAITTSIAGVIFRSMALGAYLRNHPDEDQGGVEESYELLKTIAENISSGYRDTFETLKLFLDERAQTAGAVVGKEKEYLSALGTFIDATEKFSDKLIQSENRMASQSEKYSQALGHQSRVIEEIAQSGMALSVTAGRIRSELEALPLYETGENLVKFQSETAELNLVLDSLIEILERKVQKVEA